MSIDTLFEYHADCWRCRGTGNYQVSTPPSEPVIVPCPECNATGHFIRGHLHFADSAAAKPDVFQAYAVLECIDATEYNALTAAQKEGTKIILSCGQVDLGLGKKSRTQFLNWFGAGSDTVVALTALLATDG